MHYLEEYLFNHMDCLAVLCSDGFITFWKIGEIEHARLYRPAAEVVINIGMGIKDELYIDGGAAQFSGIFDCLGLYVKTQYMSVGSCKFGKEFGVMSVPASRIDDGVSRSDNFLCKVFSVGQYACEHRHSPHILPPGMYSFVSVHRQYRSARSICQYSTSGR